MRRLCRKTRNKALDLPNITLTPFIDTVLVLLVVFMVTSPGKTSLPIQLITVPSVVATGPELNDKPVNKQQYTALVVSVNAQGKLFIDGVPTTEAHLRQGIMQGIGKSPIATVRIQTESASPSSLIHHVIDIIRQIHGVKIVFW